LSPLLEFGVLAGCWSGQASLPESKAEVAEEAELKCIPRMLRSAKRCAAGAGIIIASGGVVPDSRRATSAVPAMLQCPDRVDRKRSQPMAVDLLNIEGLKNLDHQGPIVMVNLMRFHDRSLDGNGSGWDAYLRYSALTVPMIKARGGTLLWTGDAKTVALGPQHGNQWDYLALVYYPSVAAFIDMMTSADYENLSDPHRRNGCAEHVIICTSEAYSKFKIG
jgi:uncharacterized protein (DUF1330 family)